MIYGHGDDIYAIEEKLKANFSTNVWMEGPNEKLVEAVAQMAGSIANYPEPNGEPLREMLAIHHGLTTADLMVNNGTTESIYLICQCFQNTEATILVPTFSEYEDAAMINHISCRFMPWKEMKSEFSFPTQLVFICNPNNPSGSLLPLSALDRWVSQNPQTIFVIDEAYYAFTPKAQSALELLGQYSNLIILRSLTKLFAIPGLRLGYIIGHPDLINRLQRYKIPWSVNTFALQAGIYIIRHIGMLTPVMDQLLTETQWLRTQIDQLPGYRCQPSHTTFFLVSTQRGNAADLKAYLIKHHQILIRNADNFRGLEANVFRLATQNRAKNQLLINGLAQWNS